MSRTLSIVALPCDNGSFARGGNAIAYFFVGSKGEMVRKFSWTLLVLVIVMIRPGQTDALTIMIDDRTETPSATSDSAESTISVG